jgi:hypothetical protein
MVGMPSRCPCRKEIRFARWGGTGFLLALVAAGEPGGKAEKWKQLAPFASRNRIVIGKFGRDKTDYDTVVLARASELHTGAEIEAAYVEALHRGFAEDLEPGELYLGEVLTESVPLAVTMAEPIERLRHRAQGRARPATSTAAAAERASSGRRRLEVVTG